MAVPQADRLARVVEKCRSDVDRGPTTSSLSQAPDRLLGTLARLAGYQRVTSKFCEDLEEGLRAAGIKTFPDLRDPTNTRRTRVYLFNTDEFPSNIQQSRVLFDAEATLANFLEKNFASLPEIKKMNLRLIGREKHIGPRCRIDLLAADKKTGALVGIELKAGEPRRDVVSEAASYMSALKKKSIAEDLPTPRLLIVSGQPDPEFQKQIQALSNKEGVPTQWLTYAVSMSLKEIK